MSEEHIRQIKNYLKYQFNLPDDQIDSMMPGFINTLIEHMRNLETVLTDGDLERLGKAAHTMKGALLNLGLGECAEIAYAIESSARTGDESVDYSALVLSLRAQLDRQIG